MTDTIRFRIDGVSVPALRPRVTRGGRHTYDPERSANWKALIAFQIVSQVKTTFEGPLAVSLTFWLPRPKSAPKSRVYPDRKPDLDNLTKNIMDGISQSGRCWRDDAQIVSVTAEKRYATPDEAPGVEVEVQSKEATK